jgi:hypothetical protein
MKLLYKCDNCGEETKISYSYSSDDGDLCKKCFLEKEKEYTEREYKNLIRNLKYQVIAFKERKEERISMALKRVETLDAKNNRG